jgi:SAM-dependent methyltransferase
LLLIWLHKGISSDEIFLSVTIVSVQTSNLIKTMLPAISQAGQNGPVLDLACGSGRNGIYLIKQGQPVVFADRRQAALDHIAQDLEGNELATFWAINLEHPGSNPFAGHSFAAILAFRYLQAVIRSSQEFYPQSLRQLRSSVSNWARSRRHRRSKQPCAAQSANLAHNQGHQ